MSTTIPAGSKHRERAGSSATTAWAKTYTHPHFIKHLRYILLGADLPDALILDFEKQAGNPEWVSLSDAIPLGKHARKLVRQYGLEAHQASEEFFKLCLDMGLSLSVALSIMKSVKQAR